MTERIDDVGKILDDLVIINEKLLKKS